MGAGPTSATWRRPASGACGPARTWSWSGRPPSTRTATCFRALRAWPRGEQPVDPPPPDPGSSAAYHSTLTIHYDVGTLTGLHRYPVKSCRGHALDSATVEPWGLAGDRRFMLVDDDATAVTARDLPRMVLVSPELRPDGLLVRAPGVEPLTVPLPTGPHAAVRVWDDQLAATPATAEAHSWFSEVLGASVRLMYLDDPTRRPTDPEYGLITDLVSLADSYPMLLTTEESLAALNELGPEPMTMTRFRPNLVVSGPPPWSEDGWRRVRIGDAEFRLVKACSRCVLTTVDPDTGRKGHEPLRTLARHRRWGGKVWFGVNLVPDTPGVTVRVGDPVEVLDLTDSAEPLR